MKFSKYNLIIEDSESDRIYLFNTLSGSCFSVSQETALMISEKNINSLDPETLSFFENSGVLIKDNMHEENIISFNYNKSVFSTDFLSITLVLTWSCNLKCVYCSQSSCKKAQAMSFEDADKYVKFITSTLIDKNIKNLSVTLYGGEPLLNTETGFYILETLNSFCGNNSIDFSCSIVTNGILMTEDIADRLISFNCEDIQITLDGSKELHDKRKMHIDNAGTFGDIIKTLTMLNSKRDVNTSIRINIDKDNAYSIHQLLDYIGINGIKLTNCYVSFGIIRSSPTGNPDYDYANRCLAQDAVGEIISELRSYAEAQGFQCSTIPERCVLNCAMYTENAYVFVPGCDVYKCWEHAGLEEHLIGKLDDEGNINDLTYAYYDWMSADPVKNEKCSECVYLPTCGGGCRGRSNKNMGYFYSYDCVETKFIMEKKIIHYVNSLNA